MARVLVLGGTGWLSGRIAARWVAEGADVTCLARGGRPAPEGAALVESDRARPDAYAAVARGEWDEVVDVTSRAEQVADALTAIAPRAAHWTFVSTVSVYADESTRGADESAARVPPAAPGDEYDYGRHKVAAEESVRSALGRTAMIVRPGLIAGPGDPSDRFGYWVGRFALAADGPVLVPAAPGVHVQVIDVDDLAGFIVAGGRGRATGVVNAIGESRPLADVLVEARAVAGHSGPVVTAADDWLSAHDVSHWAGPRSLPLWLPADMPGFATRSHAAYLSRGGVLSPLRDTLARTLADERVRGLGRERRAGLSRVDELALLAERARLT